MQDDFAALEAGTTLLDGLLFIAIVVAAALIVRVVARRIGYQDEWPPAEGRCHSCGIKTGEGEVICDGCYDIRQY